jgi:hypothetical protein
MDLAAQIKAKRDAAAQARRVVAALSTEEDRKRVQAFAADLEAQAAELERQVEVVTAQKPERTEIQMQQQAAKDPEKKTSGSQSR